MTATAVNYQNILVQWQQPTADTAYLDFRLVRSRYGFPVDEDDGEIVEDSGDASYPGSIYIDTGVIEGTYHYYAVYILINMTEGGPEVWYRAGVAACLAPNSSYDCGQLLLDRTPEYFKNLQDGELTTDAVGNPYLAQFYAVFGWGLDYLKTALNVAANINNPHVIPLNYLMNLATTLGISLEPEIRAGVLREAVANNGTINMQRGTLNGIMAQVEQLTGWGADLTVGYNLMLEDDQASFLNPAPEPYVPYTYYQVSDTVTYQAPPTVPVPNPPTCVYKCIEQHCGHAPTGDFTDNEWWENVYYSPRSDILDNSDTGWQNTWEPRYTNLSFSRLEGEYGTSLYSRTPDPWGKYDNFTDPDSCREFTGCKPPGCPPCPAPAPPPVATDNVITVTNTTTTTNVEVRNVSRTTEDITLMNGDPDPIQVISDGVPVPYIVPQQLWVITTEYRTGDIVFWNSQPFQALKASTGVTPPTNNIPSNEWQPIGLDERVMMMLSGFSSQDLSDLSNAQASITPFVIWYDEYGLPIVRLQPRSGSAQYQDVHCATTGDLGNTATTTVLTSTSTTSTPLVIDDHPCALNDRVCVKDQSDQRQNGYYYVSAIGGLMMPEDGKMGLSPSNWTLTRCSDIGPTQHPGSYVRCRYGTQNCGTKQHCSVPETTTVTYGTTNITFTPTPPLGFFTPANILFDSFSKASDWGAALTAHAPTTGNYTWVAQAGTFNLNGYEQGCLIPTTLSTRSEALVSFGIADVLLGLTLLTAANTGWSSGLVFRWSSDSNYWRCGTNTLKKRVAGSLTTVATHSTVFSPGDRMTVVCSGNSIIVYRNGVQVSSATDSFNSGAQSHGIIYESTT